ncbi:Xanthan lyase precursor [compost metagenome]
MNAIAKLSQVYPYVTSGDGFYTDGSFIQHLRVPYVGSYGGVALQGLADLFNLLQGTEFDITDEGRQNVYNWVFDSFEPFLY